MTIGEHRAMLADYLRVAAAKPFAWGAHDCCLFVADWVAQVTGVDPAADLRPRYDSEASALRLVARAGGIADVMAMQLRGLREIRVALPGDVGAVNLGSERVAAIRVYEDHRSSGRWACLTLKGLVVAPAVMLRGWSLCPRS